MLEMIVFEACPWCWHPRDMQGKYKGEMVGNSSKAVLPKSRRSAAQSLLLSSKPVITLESTFQKGKVCTTLPSILPSPGTVSHTSKNFLSAFCNEKVES